MQINRTSKSKLKHEYTVTMTSQEIDGKINEKLQEIGKTIKMPGFRPGKVPVKVLRSKYGKAIMGEVLEKAVEESIVKTVNENELRPAMQPKVEVKSFSETEGLECTMEIELLPEFDLADFEKIKVKKMVAKPQSKDVDETLKRISSSNKETKPIDKKRKSKSGDTLVIDFDGSVDGEKKPGMKADNFHLELGSNSFVSGFEDQLIGSKEGDHVQVKVTFPENYAHKGLRSKEAVFEVDVKEIREAADVEFNDEFAKRFGFDNIEKLKTAITDQMQDEYSKLSRMDLKRKLLDALDDKHDFEVPQGMVEAEFFSIWYQLKGKAHPEDPRAKNSKDVEVDEGTKKENDEYRKIANRRVKLGLVLAEVGRVNKVEISNQEIQQAVVAEARRYPGQESKVFEFYKGNPHALEALKAPIYEDKVVDFIIEKIKVEEKEVPIEELTKAVEDAGDDL